MAGTMAKPTVVYVLTGLAFLLFLTLSRPPKTTRCRSNRRMAHLHHAAFDPIVEKLERRVEETKPLDHDVFEEKLETISSYRDWSTPIEIAELEEYFGEDGRLNITERLTYLFYLLDRSPQNGWIEFEELEKWNQRQAKDRLIYSTARRMKVHDKDQDGAVTLLEFLSYLSDEQIDWNDRGHGKAGWWKEQFVNADKDGNGSLTELEFNDFLHPEDSKDPRIQMWLQREKLREMDANKDGRLSFMEFRDRFNDIYKNYPSFSKGESNNLQHNVANSEEKFAELDVNKDRFLTAEELKPILHHLYPGELSYATYYTKYLIHEADDDKDGKLTLKEMLNHHHAFYSTVVEEGRNDDDYDYGMHDELR